VASRIAPGCRLINIGERYPTNADFNCFLDLLLSDFEMETELLIPRWYGARDTLRVYRRTLA
jgi:hypothetical protein